MPRASASSSLRRSTRRSRRSSFDHHGDAAFLEWIDPPPQSFPATARSRRRSSESSPSARFCPRPSRRRRSLWGSTRTRSPTGETQRDADALSWCLRHGARQDLAAAYLHTPLSARRARLPQPPARGARADRHRRGGASARSRSMAEVRGRISNLAHKIVDLTDTKALVLLVEMEERVFAVVRSRGDLVDASPAAASVAEGTHRPPAILARISTNAQAGDLRTSNMPCKKPAGPAMSCRHLHGRNGGALVRDAMALSSATDRAECSPTGERPRRRVGKSRGSRQGDRPRARARTGTGSHEWARPRRPRTNATLSELRVLVTDAEDGRGCGRDAELVGVVARVDLLRALEGIEDDREEMVRAAVELESIERLRVLFDGGVARRSRRGRLPRRRHRPRHPSRRGGVRHRHRGRRRCDRVRASLAAALGGRITPHRKFGTAIVLYGEGDRIDVVTTRTEFYDAPGRFRPSNAPGCARISSVAISRSTPWP